MISYIMNFKGATIVEEPKVKSLLKAMNLLDMFTQPPYEYGVSDLARKFSYPKSTVHNIFSTFTLYGLLKYDEATQKYRLGNKAAEFGNSFRKSNSMLSIMRPYLSQISAELKETVFLATESNNEVLYIDASYSPYVAGGEIIGVRAPLYCTGIGKALLSCMDDETINRILAKPMKPFTPDTKTTPEELWNEINFIRSHGYSVDNMEHEFGVKCVAVPLINEDGHLKGAISVSGPSLRFPETTIKKYAKILKDVSLEVKHIL